MRVMSIFQDLKCIVHPYYLCNILFSLSFIVSKLVPQICEYVFTKETSCEISTWESEVLFFLIVVVIFRSHRTGNRSLLNYIALASMYAKVCGIILWFSADPVLGIIYLTLTIIHFLLVGEPVYKGPEKVVYFRGDNTLAEQLQEDRDVTWVITFYTNWSPACGKFAPVFSQLSLEYTLDNLKFGKVDVGSQPELAKKYYVNDSAISVQLPTVALYKNGKELMRRPCLDSNKKFHKFYFSEDNVRAAFDMNNVHLECKRALENKVASKKEVSHQKAE